jgi:hypothetical protein
MTLATVDLVPAELGDLLHPLSGNELRPYRGVNIPPPPGILPTAPGGTLAPLGVFRLSKPVITDTGSQLTIAITGNDRSSEIARHPWTGPYTGAAGLTVPAAITAILNATWTGPPLTYNLYPSTVVVPAGTVLGIQFTSTGVSAQSGSTSGGNNRWQDCVNLALSAGCELFFDRQGAVVMRPVPQPNTVPLSFSFVEGVTCTMTSLTRTLDEANFHNGVIVIGTGVTVTNPDGSTSPGTPVTASAYSTDPILGPSGVEGSCPIFITDETVSTVPQAQAVANAQLPLVLAALDETAFTATCNPGFDAGDANGITRARMKVNDIYIGAAVTHPLDVVTQMQVTNRSFAVAA